MSMLRSMSSPTAEKPGLFGGYFLTKGGLSVAFSGAPGR